MTSLNINVLVSAKEEYLTQMINILVPYYRKNFKKILEKSQENVMMKYKLRPFQCELRDVQKWSDIALDTRVSELKTVYPYFYDLLKAVFVIHVKILSSIKINPGGKEFSLEIPQLRLFIHRIYIETARKLYYNPNVILADSSELDDLIYNVIVDTLRSMIPIQNILSEYLNDLDEQEHEETNDDYHSVPDEEEPEPESEPVQQSFTADHFDETPNPAPAPIPSPVQAPALTPPVISYENVPPPPQVPQQSQQMPWQSQPQPQEKVINTDNPEDMMLPVLFNDAKSL